MVTAQREKSLPEKIIDFCHLWKIKEFAFFGSFLREDFHEESDIDILVTFAEGASWHLLDLVTMQYELESIFHRKVDLIEKKVIENSQNWLRRNEILSTTKTFYRLSLTNRKPIILTQ